MNRPSPETSPNAPLRRLLLRLQAPDGTTDTPPFSFDVERFADTLKRAAVAVVTLADAVTRPDASASPSGAFHNALSDALQARGIAVEDAEAADQEAVALHAVPNRPALESACYRRLCRGLPIVLADELAPAGTFDAEAYRLLSVVFPDLVLKEPWYREAQPQIEIGLLTGWTPTDSTMGAARLIQAHDQTFDLLDAAADLTPYRLIVLPEDVSATPVLTAKLLAYLEQGGKLLATREAGASPLFSEASGAAEAGKENCILLSEPHFRSYAHLSGAQSKRVVLEALNRLLPDPLLRHDAPGTLETLITSQPKHDRWILHLMHYLPMGTAFDSPILDEIFPLDEVKFSLKTPKPVARVTMRPQHHDVLDFWEHQGRLEFVVPRIAGYRMVAIEFEK